MGGVGGCGGSGGGPLSSKLLVVFQESDAIGETLSVKK